MSEHSREDALRIAKELNWREDRVNKKGYLLLLCPCGVHFKWLHKTPSDPNYFVNAIGYLKRQECSKPEPVE
jgi:hypothetical protein